MSDSKASAAERLERVQTVFAVRRARLASDIARPPSRSAGSRPLDKLQDRGYSVALLLAGTAFLPKLVGLAWRRRKLLLNAAGAGLRIRRWRTRLESHADRRK